MAAVALGLAAKCVSGVAGSGGGGPQSGGDKRHLASRGVGVALTCRERKEEIFKEKN